MQKEIKRIEYQVMDELYGAKHYMEDAKFWKESADHDEERSMDYSMICKKYEEMAKQELEHAKSLSMMLTRFKGKDPSIDMLVDFLVDINNEQISEAME
jgi:DNA repair ATPase RecN